MISDVHIQFQCHVIRPAKLLIHSNPEAQIVLGQELDWSMWVVRGRLQSPEMSYKIHKQLGESGHIPQCRYPAIPVLLKSENKLSQSNRFLRGSPHFSARSAYRRPNPCEIPKVRDLSFLLSYR